MVYKQGHISGDDWKFRSDIYGPFLLADVKEMDTDQQFWQQIQMVQKGQYSGI